MSTATTPNPATGTGLIGRALAAARTYRDTAPVEYARRHHDWQRWRHRAALARTLATALGVPIDHVSVRDDHDRRYGTLTTPREIPGDLAEVTDPATGARLYFIPDYPGASDCWLLLDECLSCQAPLVPVARVATLIDLGEHTDPDHDPGAAQFPGDPGHRDGCDRGPHTRT